MESMEKYLSTYRETSYDRSRGESLLWDERKKVYNYDEAVDEICALYRNGENLSSADAIVERDDLILFIEFKNQRLSRIDSASIRKKAFDTILLFSLLERNDQEMRKKRKGFMVLYDEDDIPSWSAYRSRALYICGRIESSPILFGLEKYLDFYQEVWTMEAERFFSSSLFQGKGN